MANIGRFTDRSPNISAAGVPSKLENLLDCLNYHSLEDEVEALLPARFRKERLVYRLPPPSPALWTGYYTETMALLSPGRKEHLPVHLMERKTSLPPDLDPLTTTFGRPTGVSRLVDHVAEDVFPQKPFGECRLEEELGQDLYRRSHAHYLVGQRRDLMYDAPKEVTYGKISRSEKAGEQARRVLRWFNQETVSRTSKGQARVRERTHYEIGKGLSPNNILEQVGEDKVFGVKTAADDTGAREGMRQGPVDKSAQMSGEYLGFLCQVRRHIQRLQPPFPFPHLVTNLKLLDKGGCGCLPLELVHQACGRLGLHLDRQAMEAVLRHLGVLHGDQTVSIYRFCDLLDACKPLPEFPKVDDIPDDLKLYESTYQAQTKHLESPSVKDLQRAAGVPSLRRDRAEPRDASCGGDRFLLVDETTVDSCIRPSIFSFYGLTPRDFMQPRTKDYMRDLWKRVGLDIPDAIFEEMWREGLTRPENDGETVCIETFRNMLDEMCEAKLVEVRES